MKTLLNDYFLIFAYPPITLVSLMVNLLSFVIFSDREFKNEQVFIYLKLQSLCISVDMVICVLGPLYALSQSFGATFLRAYAYNYLEDVLEKSELALAILAAHSCLKLVSQTHQSTANQQQKKKSYFIAIGLFVLLSLTTSHKVFQYEIQSKWNVAIGSNETGFFFFQGVRTPFGNSKFYKYIEIVSFALNNGLFLVILIFLDLKILKKSRSSISVKLKIATCQNEIKVRESMAKLTKMIVIDCANTIVCHLVIVFYYLLKSTLPGGFPYDEPLWLIVFSSYIAKFAIFFKFNKRFREN
jgi:hypothetical protein